MLKMLQLLGGAPGSHELILLRRLGAPPWEDTIANNITMLRTRIGFWGIHGFYWPYVFLPHARFAIWGTFVSLVLAAVLDWVDGPVARRWKCESSFGRFIDPFSDKAIAWSGFCVLLHHYRLQWWLVVPIAGIVSYDVSVSWLRKHNKEMRTNKVAKFKQWPLDIGITLLVVGVLLDWNALDGWFGQEVSFRPAATAYGGAALWLALALACVSAVIYARQHVAWLYVRLAPLIQSLACFF